MSRLDSLPLPERDRTGGRTVITDPFLRLSTGGYRNHYGVDWGTTDGIEVGTPVHAVVDGTIERVGNDGPYRNGRHTAGLNVWLRGDNGTRWKFFHLNRVTVPTGARVKAGQQIAEVGNSGTVAAHLHLEEHSGGWANPVDFTADARAAIAAGRWPGSTPPKPAPPVTNVTPPPTPGDDAVMGDWFTFPDGNVYTMTVSPESDTGLGWVHLGSGPENLIDGQLAGLFPNPGPPFRPLAQGNDKDDALFERHPVLSGPHKRPTHT